jgi:hypothetical protein
MWTDILVYMDVGTLAYRHQADEAALCAGKALGAIFGDILNPTQRP